MRDIPVDLGGYKLMITEAPMIKMRQKGEQQVAATDRDGVTQFVVALFAKRRPGIDGFVSKGEEIKVTLATDPGPDFDEGTYVELISACLNAYSMETEDGRTISGISFKAKGLKPLL